MSERGSNLCRATRKQHCTKAYRPFLSTMPIYDPKGTHWARYTTEGAEGQSMRAQSEVFAGGLQSRDARFGRYARTRRRPRARDRDTSD